MSYTPEDSHFKTSDTPVDIEVGTARGLRSFDVDAKGRLESVTRKYIWKPGENVAQQEYDYNRYTGREKQVPTTFHGFYSFHDGTDEYHKRSRISGVVENYGEVFIGERGFRSEKAKIVALHIPRRGFYISAFQSLIILAAWTLAVVLLSIFISIGFVLVGIPAALYFILLVVSGGEILDDWPADKRQSFKKVKVAYGNNVEYFSSRKKMLKKYPLYQHTVNPDDPKFWE